MKAPMPLLLRTFFWSGLLAFALLGVRAYFGYLAASSSLQIEAALAFWEPYYLAVAGIISVFCFWRVCLPAGQNRIKHVIYSFLFAHAVQIAVVSYVHYATGVHSSIWSSLDLRLFPVSVVAALAAVVLSRVGAKELAAQAGAT